MDNMKLVPLFNILMPLSAVVTSCLMIVIGQISEQKRPDISIQMLLAYFGCTAVNWGFMIAYFCFPHIFVIGNVIIMTTFILAQIFFYAFIFQITKIDPYERFSRWHYAAPAAMCLFMLFLVLTTPYHEQYQTIVSRGRFSGGSRLFFYVSNSKMLVRLVFSLIYTAFCFVRLFSYRKHFANFSSNHEKSSLGWVRVLLFFALSLIPIPVLGLILPRDAAISSYGLSVQVVLLVFQYAYLAFHVVKGNYTDFDDKTIATDSYMPENIAAADTVIPSEPAGADNVLKKNALTKGIFEEYLSCQRPFMNPNLKLSHIAEDLHTNRTYLSAFINTEYGINFSRLVNSSRMQEFNALKANPMHTHKADKDLAEMAGFGSYKNFKRFVESDT